MVSATSVVPLWGRHEKILLANPKMLGNKMNKIENKIGVKFR